MTIHKILSYVFFLQPSDSGIGEDITQSKEDLWNIKTVKSQHWIDKCKIYI